MTVHLRRNLEVKARLADLDSAREAVTQLGARFTVIEEQRDTYFRVPLGRLKLREIDGSSATLIWYDRPDREDVRPSTYYLVPVADADPIRSALAAALGIRGEVCKHREIHLWTTSASTSTGSPGWAASSSWRRSWLRIRRSGFRRSP